MKYGILILVIPIVRSFAQDVTSGIPSDVIPLPSPSLPRREEIVASTSPESLLPADSSLPVINNVPSIPTLPTESSLPLSTQSTPSESTFLPVPTLSQQPIPFTITGSPQTSRSAPWQRTGGPWQPLSGPWQSMGGLWQPTWQPSAGWVLQPSNWTQTSNLGQPVMWLQISNSSFIPLSSFPNGISQPTPLSSLPLGPSLQPSNSSTSQASLIPQVPPIPFMASIASMPLRPSVPSTSDGMSSIPIAAPLPSIPFMSSVPLGQQTPLTPSLPQESSTPSMPFMSPVPLGQQTPSTPLLSQESSTPSIPLMPTSPEIPLIPSIPQLSLTPSNPTESSLPISTKSTPSESTLPPIPTLSQQTIPFLMPGSPQTSMPAPLQPTGGPWQSLSGPWQYIDGSWQPTWQPPIGWVLQPSNWTQTSNSGQPLMRLQISNSSFNPFSSFSNGISQPTPLSSLPLGPSLQASNSLTTQASPISQVPPIPFMPPTASIPLGSPVPLPSGGMSSTPIAPPFPSIPFMSSIPLGQQIPSTPSLSQESSTPSIPLIPSTPQVPPTPSMPPLPKVPRIPSVPLTPPAPQVPLTSFSPQISSLLSGQYNLEDAYIRRPCEVFDKFCIRQYFQRHSHCKEVYGPVPDPLYRDQSTAYYPHVNLTVVSNNLQYFGLNGRIEEFYVNKKTDNLVLAVEFRNLTTTSDSVSLRFHRNAQEPILLQDMSSSIYASIVVTITIPNLKDLQVASAEVFGYVNDALPVQAYGPQGFVSTDPTVLQVATEMVATAPISVKELQLTESVFYIGKYIQYDICDFGLDVI